MVKLRSTHCGILRALYDTPRKVGTALATIIESSGAERSVSPANGTFFTYDEIRAIIGGALDTLPTRNEQILFFYANSPHPRNYKAMELAGLQIEPEAVQEADYIHGTVLLCTQAELRTGQKRKEMP